MFGHFLIYLLGRLISWHLWPLKWSLQVDHLSPQPQWKLEFPYQGIHQERWGHDLSLTFLCHDRTAARRRHKSLQLHQLQRQQHHHHHGDKTTTRASVSSPRFMFEIPCGAKPSLRSSSMLFYDWCLALRVDFLLPRGGWKSEVPSNERKLRLLWKTYSYLLLQCRISLSFFSIAHQRAWAKFNHSLYHLIILLLVPVNENIESFGSNDLEPHPWNIQLHVVAPTNKVLTSASKIIFETFI